MPPRSSRSIVKYRGREAWWRPRGLGPGAGVEPALTGSESVVLPAGRSRSDVIAVGGMGIEPTSIGLRDRCVALTPTSHSHAARSLS